MNYVNLKEGEEHEYYSLSSSRKKTEKVFIAILGETHSLIMNHAFWGRRKVPNKEIFETQHKAREYFENYSQPSEFEVGDVVKSSIHSVRGYRTLLVMEIKKSKATLKCCETGEIVNKVCVDSIVKAPLKEDK
jgi:hypothetical protein